MTRPLENIKSRIVSLLNQVNDPEVLTNLEEALEIITTQDIPSEKLFVDGGINIEPAGTFDEVFAAQGYKKPSFDEISEEDESAWHISLDEMLAALD